MNRIYETVFVISPVVADEEADRIVSTMEGIARERGAEVKTDRWGKRRLAFDVMRHKEGNYVLFTIETPDVGIVHELERRLRIDDNVIRYLSVRVDEERRRALKISKARGIPPPWERKPEPIPEPPAGEAAAEASAASEEDIPGEEEEP